MDALPIEVQVECYAGWRADERPDAFWLDIRRLAVRDITARWMDEHYAYFAITGEDGGRYVLRRDDRHGRWDLMPTSALASYLTKAHN